MKKILLICNIAWLKADFRFGLKETLARMENIEFRHNYLADDFSATYKDFKPDIIISVKKFWTPQEYILIDDSCIKIQLSPDDPDIYLKTIPYIYQFSHWFTNSHYALEHRYKRDCYKNVEVCGFACDDKLYESIQPDSKYKSDIIFAGNMHKKKYRIEYLNALSGLDLKVYGKWNKPVYGYTGINLIGEEYIKALKSAKIGLDFALSGSRYLNVKSKIFELAAAKCLIVVDEFKEMELYFDYNTEIIGFNSPEELRDKVEYYLKHDNERNKIVNACYKRFLAEHTWERRINHVFKKAGIIL